MNSDARHQGVVIPLHGDPALADRAATRRRPRPGTGEQAEVYPLGTGAEAALAVRPGSPWERRAAGALDFLQRRLTGDYAVDRYGYDEDLTESVALPTLRALYRRWFRVEVNGIANVPSSGGALLVANHAGGIWPFDAAMTAVAVHDEHPARRTLRLLASSRVFATPVVGTLARRTGSTLACTPDAEGLLRGGELVGTFPEGLAGIGKHFRDRYELQPFGSAVFVDAAMSAGVPIVPVSIVGAEEIHPVLGRARTLARVLNVPYVPLTPTFPWLGALGLVPLPSKWYIEFGDPIATDGIGRDELTDRVRETIQTTLYRLLVQRRSVWR